jgi:transposase-like protein
MCQAMVTQEYTYAYAAVSVTDGVLDSLILPHVNTDCMQVFLDEVAARHSKERIVMITDGAGWHNTASLTVPENMRRQSCPHTRRNSIRLSIYGMTYEKNHFITGHSIA